MPADEGDAKWDVRRDRDHGALWIHDDRGAGWEGAERHGDDGEASYGGEVEAGKGWHDQLVELQ